MQRITCNFKIKTDHLTNARVLILIDKRKEQVILFLFFLGGGSLPVDQRLNVKEAGQIPGRYQRIKNVVVYKVVTNVVSVLRRCSSNLEKRQGNLVIGKRIESIQTTVQLKSDRIL